MIAVRYGVSPIVVVYRVNELKLASSERVAQLKQEIEERLHEQVAKHLALEPLEDRIATFGAPVSVAVARRHAAGRGGRGERSGRHRLGAGDGPAALGVRAAGEEPVELVHRCGRLPHRESAERLEVGDHLVVGNGVGAEERPAGGGRAKAAPEQSPRRGVSCRSRRAHRRGRRGGGATRARVPGRRAPADRGRRRCGRRRPRRVRSARARGRRGQPAKGPRGRGAGESARARARRRRRRWRRPSGQRARCGSQRARHRSTPASAPARARS